MELAFSFPLYLIYDLMLLIYLKYGARLSMESFSESALISWVMNVALPILECNVFTVPGMIILFAFVEDVIFWMVIAKSVGVFPINPQSKSDLS